MTTPDGSTPNPGHPDRIRIDSSEAMPPDRRTPKEKPFPWVPVLVLLGITVIGVLISLDGAKPQPSDVAPADSGERWYWPPSWGLDEAAGLKARFEELRKEVGSILTISALIYLTATFFGAPVAEWCRAQAATRLQLGRTAVRDLAVAAFAATCCLVGVLVFAVPKFEHARYCAIILLAGASYPFLVKVLPGISRDDKALRMEGVREVKAILSILAISLIAFYLLIDGLGGMINPSPNGQD